MRVRRGEHDQSVAFDLLDDHDQPIAEVAGFMRHLSARDCSPNTLCAYAHDLLHFYQFLELTGLTLDGFGPPESLSLLEHLRRVPSRRPARRLDLVLTTTTAAGSSATRLAAATVNRILAAISSFYEYLIVAGRWPTENPIQRRPDPALARVSDRHRPFMGAASRQRPVRRVVRVKTIQRLPRPLDEEHVAALLGTLDRWRDRAMVLLMLHGGLRPGEVLCLHLADVQYGRRRVIVRYHTDHPKGARTKSRTERVVDLHEPATLEAVSRYVMDERPRDAQTPLIFLVGGHGTKRREPLSYAALVRLFQRRCDALSIRQPWVTPHALRHTHATRMWEGGMRAFVAETSWPRLPRVDPHLHASLRRGGRGRLPPGPGAMRRMNVVLVAQRTRRSHAPADAFGAYLERMGVSTYAQRCLLAARRRFVKRYPDLEEWFAAPLALRVGRLGRRPNGAILSDLRSYQARPYLLFLALSGYAELDWEWLLAVGQLTALKQVTRAGLDLGFDAFIEDAVRLGFARETAKNVTRWVAGRIALHRGGVRVDHITATDVDELGEAMQAFAQRSDVSILFGSAKAYQQQLHVHLRYVRQVRLVLYHRGQIDRQPDPVRWQQAPRPMGPLRMHQVAERFLAARRLTDRPSTLQNLTFTLRCFIVFLTEIEPSIESFAQVEREHVLAFAKMLAEEPTGRTGRPASISTRRGRLSAVSSFFRETAAWGWDDVPGRPLLTPGDLPKPPRRIPRYIPADELERLMAAIRALPCPFQRTALLVARWSGARREEIRRLSLDCLDRYPDGTARLRVPAGKTRTERVIPLHEEAATAIRSLQADRGAERGLSDELTGTLTRYLFVRRGGLFSMQYLFNIPLRSACTLAGLVTSMGVPTVSAHRFRHTVGTQLAERGAKLHTIMQVLGHTSANMAMVYAHISDREVLRDYQAVLGPAATIAGPYAETLRMGGLSADEMDWIKTNFFKTELELGHCLRLPQEGPCECELYLTCAKFVTTTEYAPRLRSRRERELQLVDDAVSHGWEREVERHRATARRIDLLLAELGTPFDESCSADTR